MLPARITERVQKTESCWLWTGPLQTNGYSSAKWKVNGKWNHARVHRLYYEEYVGPIPVGLEIDHLCRVRNCVNPDHLRAVTRKENAQNRVNRPAPTACKQGHVYTPDSAYVYINERGQQGRSCKACMRRRSAAHYLARKAALLQPQATPAQ